MSEDTTLGIRIVFAESLRKGVSWHYGPRSFCGFPHAGRSRRKTYATLSVRGLTRKPGERPGRVEVEIAASR